MNDRTNAAVASVPFIDVAAQRQRLGRAIDDAVARVLNHCQFILGPEIKAAEEQLAVFCGTRHAITCASGTDALLLPLMAKGIGPGDAVICPSFTFCATAEVVALAGATPVFADVDEATFNLDPKSIGSAIMAARHHGLNAKAIIPVDLFGQPADHAPIADIARGEGLFVLDDAAATSFFPAKPLGVYGDGGAVFTDDDELAAIMRSLRVHGEGRDKYDCVRIGLNGRMDAIQAAVLIEKLKIFPDEIVARDRIARRYSAALADVATVPRVAAGSTSVWAQYTLRLEAGRRDGLAAALRQQGIPTAIYYAKPVHVQEAYKRFPVAEGGLAVSERLADEVISLPMHAYLDEPTQDRIIGAVRRALGA